MRVAIGDVRDGGDRLGESGKMINAIEETQKRGVNCAEHRLCICAASCCTRQIHPCKPLFEKLGWLRAEGAWSPGMDHSPDSAIR